MKKFGVIFLSILILCSSFSALNVFAESVNVVNGLGCRVGSEVTYTAYLTTPEKMEDIQVQINYSSSLSLISADYSDKLNQDGNFVHNENLENEVKFNSICTLSPMDFTQETRLVTLKFKVDKAGESKINIEIQCLDSVTDKKYGKNQNLENYKKIILKETVNTNLALKANQNITGVKGNYIKTGNTKKFTLKAKAKTKIKYTSSNKKIAEVSNSGVVKIKKPGCVYITVKAIETTGCKSATKKIKVIVIPKDFNKKDMKSIKKIGKDKIEVKWKKDKYAKGYLLQVSTDKYFRSGNRNVKCKKSMDAAVINKLKKGKKCYLRICSYITVSGKKYSNNWVRFSFKHS